MTHCQYCQEHLIAYINNEATPRIRRRVADHLHSCETCYAIYTRERDAAQQLSRELTLFGRANDNQLDSLWSVIQDEIETPEPITRTNNGKVWQRGLVLVALAVLCALPWSLSWGDLVSVSIPLRATPAVVPYDNGTPAGTEGSDISIVALSTGTPTDDMLPPTATSTPMVAPIPGN